MKKQLLTAFFVAGALGLSSAQANEFSPQIQKFFDENVKPQMSDPLVIGAVNKQNIAHKGLTPDAINALDQEWRAEAKVGGGALIEKVMAKSLSKFLNNLKAQHPEAITEVFIMDNHGLNVGQSDITSDYNQGDEGKWQKTFSVGPNAVFIDDVEFDDSTESFQSQISATIVDPASGAPIGAITIGLNVEKLI